jgi:hypothetical protein
LNQELLPNYKFVGIVTIRIFIMETKSPNDYSGNRLELRDIGVSAEELEALKPKPDNVVDINDYRKAKEELIQPAAQPVEAKDTKERNKNVKVVLLAGATLLGSAKLTIEAFKEKIHPAAHVQSADELNTATTIEVEGIEPGTQLEVSPYSFTVTGGNIRTSPHVEGGGEDPGDNLVQNTDLTGKVITHPIEVADDSNEKNGNWYVFFDSDGQKFAINEQNVQAIPDHTITNGDDIRVTVDKDTNMGIIAHDANNVSMQVATVVEATN